MCLQIITCVVSYPQCRTLSYHLGSRKTEISLSHRPLKHLILGLVFPCFLFLLRKKTGVGSFLPIPRGGTVANGWYDIS